MHFELKSISEAEYSRGAGQRWSVTGCSMSLRWLRAFALTFLAILPITSRR